MKKKTKLFMKYNKLFIALMKEKKYTEELVKYAIGVDHKFLMIFRCQVLKKLLSGFINNFAEEFEDIVNDKGETIYLTSIQISGTKAERSVIREITKKFKLSTEYHQSHRDSSAVIEFRIG